MENADFPELARRDIWHKNARWWDAKTCEGNNWHLSLIAPAVERLLRVEPVSACWSWPAGTGSSRGLASLGVQVLACDSSTEFLECARQRTHEHSEHIEYCLLDFTSEEHLAA